jgi:hypothetical protein
MIRRTSRLERKDIPRVNVLEADEDDIISLVKCEISPGEERR